MMETRACYERLAGYGKGKRDGETDRFIKQTNKHYFYKEERRLNESAHDELLPCAAIKRYLKGKKQEAELGVSLNCYDTMGSWEGQGWG